MSNADATWQLMAHFVMDNRNVWRRNVAELTGLPNNTIRVLRRVTEHTRSIGEIAAASGLDAPATTVAINTLESHGMVRREVDPLSRRRKVVHATEAGIATMRKVDALNDPAPKSFATLRADEVATLHRLIERVVEADKSALSTADDTDGQ